MPPLPPRRTPHAVRAGHPESNVLSVNGAGADASTQASERPSIVLMLPDVAGVRPWPFSIRLMDAFGVTRTVDRSERLGAMPRRIEMTMAVSVAVTAAGASEEHGRLPGIDPA